MAHTSFLRRLLVFAFLLALSPRLSWADAIVLIDRREMTGSARALDAINPGSIDSYFETSLFGLPFSASDSAAAVFGSASAVAVNSQDSSIGPLLFDFTGTAFSGSISDPTLNNSLGLASSLYQVDFRLSEPHFYSFDVALEANHAVGANLISFSSSEAYLLMFGFGILHDLSVISGTDTFSASGTLAPGDYEVVFVAVSQSLTGTVFGPSPTSGGATTIGSLVLTPVDAPIPEPTTIVLVTSGLVGMGVRQWRKRRGR
jgi:hypothetical protein